MPVRRFNGSSDWLRTGIGSCNWTFGSMAALVRVINYPGAEGGYVFSNTTTTPTNQAGMRLNAKSGKPFLSGAWSADHPATTEVEKNVWYIIALTKETGTKTPRIHIGKWTGSKFEWVHENETGTETNSPAQTGGTIFFGARRGPAEFLNMDLAAVIQWPSVVLSDAECEGLGTQTSLKKGWKEYKSPSGLWTFEQASVTEEVKDLIGAGNQTERNGTSVTAEEPPIPYTASESKTVEITASLSSTSEARASVKIVRIVRASLSSTSSLGGTVRIRKLLAAMVTGTSPITAKLSRTANLAVTIEADSGITAQLSITRLIKAAVTSTSEIFARLDTGGRVLPTIDLPSGLRIFEGARLVVKAGSGALGLKSEKTELRVRNTEAELELGDPSSLSVKAVEADLNLKDTDAKAMIDG